MSDINLPNRILDGDNVIQSEWDRPSLFGTPQQIRVKFDGDQATVQVFEQGFVDWIYSLLSSTFGEGKTYRSPVETSTRSITSLGINKDDLTDNTKNEDLHTRIKTSINISCHDQKKTDSKVSDVFSQLTVVFAKLNPSTNNGVPTNPKSLPQNPPVTTSSPTAKVVQAQLQAPKTASAKEPLEQPHLDTAADTHTTATKILDSPVTKKPVAGTSVSPQINTQAANLNANNALIEQTGKWANYYTDDKVPMQTFLKGIGCELDGSAHTKAGAKFLQKDNYDITVPARKDFANAQPVTLTISKEKIESILKSAQVVVSPTLGTDGYKAFLKMADDQNAENVRDVIIPKDEKLSYSSAEMAACQVCHSARLPVLTVSLKKDNLALQQLVSTNLDEAAEIVLLNAPGANFAYGNGFSEAFLDEKNQLKTQKFEQFIEGLWTNIIFSAMHQNATDLSLLPIGMGVFLEGLSQKCTGDVQKAYLTALKVVLEKNSVQNHFKNGVFFSLGPISEAMAKEVFKDSSYMHFHQKDALNLAQNISEEPKRCCALLNPSDGDVMFGLYNVGEYWQTSQKNTPTHVGEEFLMHVIPGQLTGRDMCPEAFDNPRVAQLA